MSREVHETDCTLRGTTEQQLRNTFIIVFFCATAERGETNEFSFSETGCPNQHTIHLVIILILVAASLVACVRYLITAKTAW